MKAGWKEMKARATALPARCGARAASAEESGAEAGSGAEEATAEGCRGDRWRQALPRFWAAIALSPYGWTMHRSASNRPGHLSAERAAPPWHALTADEAARRLATDPRHGLAGEEP